MVADLQGNVIHSISWRLASDLVRRHPSLTIRREFPAGGTYDCLVIRSDRGLVLSLNRVGRIHLECPHVPTAEARWGPVEWIEYVAAEPREFLSRLETASGLPSVTGLPRSTPRVLVYRLLAAIAGLQAFSEPAEISMGVVDSSSGSHLAEWAPRLEGAGKTSPADPADCWRVQTRDLDFLAVAGGGSLLNAQGARLDVNWTYDEFGRRFAPLLGSALVFGAC